MANTEAKPGKSEVVGIKLDALAIVIDCARSYVEDIESGIADGTYFKSENTDLPQKLEALKSLEDWHMSAVLQDSPIPVTLKAPIDKEPAELLPIKTDSVYANHTGEVGVLWRDITLLENELSKVLHGSTFGTAVVLGDDIWFLEPQVSCLVLLHATYRDGKVMDKSSRFDFDLDWEDAGEEGLAYYRDRLLKALVDCKTQVIEALAMMRYEVRVIREITQFVDLVVIAGEPESAIENALQLAGDERADRLFENNERPHDGWETYVNNDDVSLVGDDIELTRLTRVDEQQTRGDDVDEAQQLRPIRFSGGLKSISDDDKCADCMHCQFQPGGMSACAKNWPGLEDLDGYVKECPAYQK